MSKFISDKTAAEHMFPLFLLQTLVFESLSSQQERFSKIVVDAVAKVGQGKDIPKLIRRCARMSHDSLKSVVDLKDKKLSGHKFIITVWALCQAIIDSGYLLPSVVVEVLDPFMEVEANQPLPEGEWLLLKASAEKQAKKILANLQKVGYYQ